MVYSFYSIVSYNYTNIKMNYQLTTILECDKYENENNIYIYLSVSCTEFKK